LHKQIPDLSKGHHQSKEDALVSGSGFDLADKGQLGTERHRFLSSE
jgi:hypothetical protein